MKGSDKVYFIHNEELFVGQLISKKKTSCRIRTFTTEESFLNVPTSLVFESFREADNFFQKKFPEKDVDLDSLMDTVRFLEHFDPE